MLYSYAHSTLVNIIISLSCKPRSFQNSEWGSIFGKLLCKHSGFTDVIYLIEQTNSKDILGCYLCKMLKQW